MKLQNFPTHKMAEAAEAHSYLHQPFPVQAVRNQISFFRYLPQGFLGCSVQLEFEDIDGIFRLHHGIGTAAGAAHFRLDELPQQGEDHIEDGLVMAQGNRKFRKP